MRRFTAPLHGARSRCWCGDGRSPRSESPRDLTCRGRVERPCAAGRLVADLPGRRRPSPSGAGRAAAHGACRASRKATQVGGELVQEARGEPVPGEPPQLSRADGTGLSEDAQVVADGGLLGARLSYEMAGAHLLFREQFDDPQAERICQQPEQGCPRGVRDGGC